MPESAQPHSRRGKTVRVGVAVAAATGVMALLLIQWAHRSATPPLDQMVGQMLMMGFQGTGPESDSAKALAQHITTGKVGSIITLGYNFKTPEGVLGLTALFHRAERTVPVFLAVDEEGGLVQRLGAKLGYRKYPSAEAVGNSMTPDDAAKLYTHIADDVKEAGFNMNLGPVVDFGTDPRNPLVHTHRVYGADPGKVTEFARAFIQAQRREGILAVLKHYPGHGSSLTDTHDDFVDVSTTWRREELEPYRALIASGDAQAVMVGHLLHNELAPEGRPVTMSAWAIQHVLRSELGFQGLVICDDLQMAAIRNHYGLEQATIEAINAGVDIVMITNQIQPDPELPAKINAMICKAVEDGRIKFSTIEASWKRIMKAKAALVRD